MSNTFGGGVVAGFFAFTILFRKIQMPLSIYCHISRSKMFLLKPQLDVHKYEFIKLLKLGEFKKAYAEK